MQNENTTWRAFPDNWLGPMDFSKLFPGPQPVEVDLGCGKGRFLLARAAGHPDIRYLGIDRMLRRIRKIDRKLTVRSLTNVRLMRVEGYYAVTYLIPEASISTYYVFFPDPWPKKKHHGNRLFNERFLEAMLKTLKPGGRIHVATDHEPYFEQIQAVLERCNSLDPIQPFFPSEEEKTDFERWYQDKTAIGRCSFEKKE